MKKGVEEKGMEKAFYASKIRTYAELLEFLQSLDYEKLEIESINISFSTKIDESQKVEVSIDEVIDNGAKADLN